MTSILAMSLGAGGGSRTHTGVNPTDFESASSANSNTPASIILSHLPIPIRENGGTSWRDIKTKLHIQFSKSLAKSRVYTKVV